MDGAWWGRYLFLYSVVFYFDQTIENILHFVGPTGDLSKLKGFNQILTLDAFIDIWYIKPRRMPFSSRRLVRKRWLGCRTRSHFVCLPDRTQKHL
jgi:hypothetical protein